MFVESKTGFLQLSYCPHFRGVPRDFLDVHPIEIQQTRMKQASLHEQVTRPVY
jgi:hypothetical protein